MDDSREATAPSGPMVFGTPPGARRERTAWLHFSTRLICVVAVVLVVLLATLAGLAWYAGRMGWNPWGGPLVFFAALAFIGYGMWRSSRQYVIIDPDAATIEFYRSSFAPDALFLLPMCLRRRRVVSFADVRAVRRHRDRHAAYISVYVPRGRIVISDGFASFAPLWATLSEVFPVRTRPEYVKRVAGFLTLLLVGLLVAAGIIVACAAFGWL